MVRSLRTGVVRKPWGQGKAAQQKYTRRCTAFNIAQLLNDRLDHDQIHMTGVLFPRGTLKKRSNRRLFEWVPQYHGRVFTKPLLKQVVRVLLRTNPNIPMDPSQTWSSFVSIQSKRLGRLVRQAKRIKARF